jgi:malonyl CoA-acyl carrier protein transacylase
MAHHQANHPIASVAHAPVMVAGFSQGGITAGAFAQDYSSQYNIQRIVTAGGVIDATHAAVFVVKADETVSESCRSRGYQPWTRTSESITDGLEHMCNSNPCGCNARHFEG